jgi:hypothetical protein
LVFTVGLSATSGKTVEVDFATADGSATVADNDYVANGGTLAFNPGETSKQVSVLINGDTAVEPDETFFVDLIGAANAAISDDQGVGTITNDDAAATVTLSIDDVALLEGHSGATAFVFTVSLSSVSTTAVTVNYATANGSAKSSGKNPDFGSTSGTLTIPAGSPSGTITVLVNGDTLVEPNETFFVNLNNTVGATIVDAQGIGTILNDEPMIAIDNVSLAEGNTGTTAFVFAVSLSVPTTVPVTVKYATANGTASSTGRNADYTKVSGTLTIPAGSLSGTITVLVNGDNLSEPDETFFVNLSSPVGASIADGQGVGTIVNDDGVALRLAAKGLRPRRGLAPLTRHILAPLVDEALERWQAAGVEPGKFAALRRMKIQIRDLPGRELGRSYTDRIVIDRDAAKRGWYVDPVPSNDSELVTEPLRARSRRGVDLLSVLMHEFGHALGLEHQSSGVMADTLAPRVRVSPNALPVEATARS